MISRVAGHGTNSKTRRDGRVRCDRVMRPIWTMVTGSGSGRRRLPRTSSRLVMMIVLVIASVYVCTKQQFFRRRQNTVYYQLPTVQLVGIQKAGTSALSVWLYYNGNFSHAQKFDGEPFYYEKEVHFFDLDERFEKGIEFYAARFNHTASPSASPPLGRRHGHRMRHIMDATPDTFQRPYRVKAVYEKAGGNQLRDLRIMVILREPISRLLSLYNHLASEYRKALRDDPSQITNWHRQIVIENEVDGTTTTTRVMTFEEYVDARVIPELQDGILDRPETAPSVTSTRHGLYAKFLSVWFKIFNRRQQILVMSYDELVKDPDTLQGRMKQFLRIENDITPGSFMSGVNTFTDPDTVKLSSVSPATIEKLKSIFDPLNDELYSLLDTHQGPPMEQRPFPKFELST